MKLSSSQSEKLSSDRTMMLFDLSVRGHHPSYIQHLIRYWCEHKLPGHLAIVVSQRFMQEHADVVEFASKMTQDPADRVRFVPITSADEAALSSRKSSFKRALRHFQEWRLFCKYADTLKATHGVLLYFDTYQLPLIFGVRSPCPVSGIYFRPTFHYSEFAQQVSDWRDRFQQWREKQLLLKTLQNPQLKTLLCLDPFAVKSLNQQKVVHLPDPVDMQFHPESGGEDLRMSLGIEPGRQVFLLFGALTQRKGVDQLLDAIAKLPPDLAQKLCLLLVGESSVAAALEAKIAEICQTLPVQFVRRYEFIPESEIPPYFELADVILAPYQRHVGMSGILLWAAAAQKPVLSSNYGLMGEMVRRYELGLTVDSTSPNEIARGLTQGLLESATKWGDRAKMKAFAEQNAAEQFARVMFEYV